MTIWQTADRQYLRRSEFGMPGARCTPCTTRIPHREDQRDEGTTNVFDGGKLGKISGKWAVIIGFDNKVMAGAWLPGQ
jgi:hypothetical protein